MIDVMEQLALLIDGAFTSDGRLSKANAVRILQGGAAALLGDPGAAPGLSAPSPSNRTRPRTANHVGAVAAPSLNAAS